MKDKRIKILMISAFVLGFIILYNISVAEEKWLTISVDNGLPNKFVKEIKSDGKNIYIATANGLGILNITDNKIKAIKKENGLADDYINSLDFDDRYVWLGTDNGLSRYDKKTGKIINYTKSDGLVDNAIGAVLVDGDYVWVGTKFWGISRFDRSINKWETFSIIHGLVDNSISCFAIDSSFIWIGTKNGLSYFDKVTGMLSGYDTTQGLPEGNIRSIQVSGQYVWLGTVNGLVRFDKYEETFKLYTTTDGLADDYIQYLNIDGTYLWIGTFSGVTKYDMLRDKWFTYTIKDGLVENSVSAVEIDGNYVWLGTDGGGMSRFDKGIPQSVISPFSYYSKKGRITLMGIAFHYDNIKNYKLEYKNDAMKDYLATDISLASGGNVKNSKLAEWDVAKLLNINYDVRLTVTDKNGRENVSLGTFIIDTKPPQLTLDTMPEAVRSPTVFVKGTYIDDNMKEINITVNKKLKEKADLNRILKKYTKELQLNPGENQITIQAVDIANQASVAIERTVVYDKDKPVITLAEYPQSVDEREIILEGTIIDSGIQKVILNPGNEEIQFTKAEEKKFSFKHKVKLEAGMNKFEISAYDFVGNKATVTPLIESSSKVPTIGLDRSIMKVNEPDFIIKGRWKAVNGLKSIFIEPFNQEPEIERKNNTYSLKVKLREGENVITANIVDKEGARNFDAMTIFYSTEKGKFDLASIPKFTSYKVLKIEGMYQEPNLDKITVNPGNIRASIDKRASKFSADLTLEKAENEFELVMNDKYGVKNKKTFKIIFDELPPEIKIDKMPSTVYDAKISMTGTYKEKYIDRIVLLPDDIQCKIDTGKNSFSASLILKEGQNDYQIVAYDKANNKTIIEQSFTYISGGAIVKDEEIDSEYVKKLKAEIERLKRLLASGGYQGVAVERKFVLPNKSGLAMAPYTRLKVDTFMDIAKKYLGSLVYLDFLNKYNNIQSAHQDNNVLIPTKNFIRQYMQVRSRKVRDILDIAAVSYRYAEGNFTRFKKFFGLYLMDKKYINKNSFDLLIKNNKIIIDNAVITINKHQSLGQNDYVVNINYGQNFMSIDVLQSKIYSKK